MLRLADVADPAPGTGQVLVGVRATGVNRADLLQRMGRYPPPPGAPDILGLELAGEVVALGPGCTQRKVGERVMAIVEGGAYATLAVVPEAQTLLVPEPLDWRAAAAIPEAFLTAYLNLFDLGQLAAGESVLVHAGASGVGVAAIQLAREAGAMVLATARGEAKLDLCRSLGAAAAILPEGGDFAPAVREATAGAGVHLVLDFVGAPYWAGNADVLRRGGRLILIGFLGGSRGDVDLSPILRKSLVVRGTTLRGLPAADKASLVERAGEFLLPRLAAGSLRAVVDRSFPLAEAATAHNYMSENRNLGKIVLEL